MKKYGKALTNLFITGIILLLIVFALPQLLAFFAPFVIGWIIAWMAGPIVSFFEKKIKIKRHMGSAFVIIAVIAIIVFLLYLGISTLIREGIGLAASVPELMTQAQAELAEIEGRMERLYQTLPQNMQKWLENADVQLKGYVGETVGKMGTPTIAVVSKLAKYLPTVLIGVIMALLSAYFFVAEREGINAWCKKRVPKVLQDRFFLIKNGMLHAVGGYFKAQFKIEIWVYFLLVIGLWILKVKYVLLIALGIAFLDFLPIFGTGTVMVPWAIFKILSGDYKMAIGLLIIWGLGQLLRQIIQPKIVGDSIGLSPLPTLLLLYLGYRFDGVIGMIVAIPVGLIFYSLYEGGVFDTTVNSLNILVNGINRFRKLTPEDLKSEELKPEEQKGKGQKRDEQKSGEQKPKKP